MNNRLDQRGGGGGGAGAGAGGGGGGGEREFFLSTHRCPEVDLLPHHSCQTQIPPPCSVVPAETSRDVTCRGQSEENYLDISSTCHSKEEEEEEKEVKVEEDEEGSVSDWSEEDLSLHFSPSVIILSDEEESDPESGFECIDVTMETQVKGSEGEGQKMVPKRLIQLKKKNNNAENNTEKLQVILKDGPAEGGGAYSEVSANELLCPTIHHCPDLLLRQHSMPASLHTHSTTSSDVESYRVYRGLVGGASPGFADGDVGMSAPRQRLQKSFSLDETKTKMASCIIKSVLSKKMQVEQNTWRTSDLQKKPEMGLHQQGREGGGGGVSKAPVHVVRDVRSLLKNTYSLSFSTTTTHDNNNQTSSFKLITQQDSPPPTYQQAVGVKGSLNARGHVTKVTAALSQSQDRDQSNRLSQQRRSSEPMKREADDVTWPVSSDQSGRTGGVSHQAGTSLPPSVFVPPPPPSSIRHPQGTKPPPSTQDQDLVLGLVSQSAPKTSHQILHPCFYTPSALPVPPPTLQPPSALPVFTPTLQPFSALPVFAPTLQPHPERVSFIQTKLRAVPPLRLLKRSEENWLTGSTSDHLDAFIRTRTARDHDNNSNTVTPATQEQHEQHKQHKQHEQQQPQQQLQQQQFLCSLQGFLPAQVGSDFLIEIPGAVAAPRALLSSPAPHGGPAPIHMMLEPKSGRYFYVDAPPPPQRKMLLDPETGQYIQVFLPAARSAPNTGVFPVRCANSTPTVMHVAPAMVNPSPTILSVMQFQPTVAISSLYAPPCLPSTLHRPSVNFTHTAP
ncbi:uncharacterized protein prob1 [Epinephelus moara]|uniref:uncharacterized protein prob1 n=1 Tax=Epinephelus moara TaxID=300413 RepID=UPI00214ECC51|nr:uncharacterized protein prob1 [Epinephelus moara]